MKVDGEELSFVVDKVNVDFCTVELTFSSLRTVSAVSDTAFPSSFHEIVTGVDFSADI